MAFFQTFETFLAAGSPEVDPTQHPVRTTDRILILQRITHGDDTLQLWNRSIEAPDED